MKISGKKNLVVYLWVNSSLSDRSDELTKVKLACRVGEILPGTYHAFGNVLVYCHSYRNFEIFDDDLFRNLKEL